MRAAACIHMHCMIDWWSVGLSLKALLFVVGFADCEGKHRLGPEHCNTVKYSRLGLQAMGVKLVLDSPAMASLGLELSCVYHVRQLSRAS